MPNRDFNPPYKRVPAIPELKSVRYPRDYWDDSQANVGTWRNGVISLTLAPLVGGLEQYRFDVSDNAQIPPIQLSHSIRLGTLLEPHLHLCNKDAIAASPQNIRFLFEWAWVDINGTITGTGSDDKTLDVGGLSALTHFLMGFDDIVPGAGQNEGVSSVFLCRIERVAAAANAYNTANIFTFGFDLHYIKDTPGSRERRTK